MLGFGIIGGVGFGIVATHVVAAAVGASLGGYFFTRDSTYDLVWSGSIVLVVIAGVLVFLVKNNPQTRRVALVPA